MTHFVCRLFGRGLIAVGALAGMQFAAGGVRAADYALGPMHITEPWARATPKGASTGAGYLTVTNTGTAPDRLSCKSSEAAASCQIHSMTMDHGVMKMRPVEGGLAIGPGETVTLKPGGLHMMFVDIKHPLEPGKTVEAKLQFEKAGTVTVEMPILPFGAPGPNAAGGSTMGGTMGGSMGGTMGGAMKQAPGMMQQMDKH